jgi:hypothetical protein
LNEIKTCIGCQEVTIYSYKQGSFDPKNLPLGVFAQKAIVDGKYIDVISLSNQP